MDAKQTNVVVNVLEQSGADGKMGIHVEVFVDGVLQTPRKPDTDVDVWVDQVRKALAENIKAGQGPVVAALRSTPVPSETAGLLRDQQPPRIWQRIQRALRRLGVWL